MTPSGRLWSIQTAGAVPGDLLGCRPVFFVLATHHDMAFDYSRSRWFWIGYLIAGPEGPSFISSTVARSRVDRLTLVIQDPLQKWTAPNYS